MARIVTVLAVIAATLAGGYLALVSFHQERELSVGGIRVSVSPGHKGALDLYVPLVDWGARFESIRLPVRLRVDVRTVDRTALRRVADGARFDVEAVRGEARDAIAAYLRAMIGIVVLCGLALGLLTAFAVRHHGGPRLRWMIGAAAGTAVGMGIALVVLIPPRGEMDQPQYYAYGSDIPRALDAVAAVQRSGRAVDQELDAQLVGLARLVITPGDRPPTEGRPRITVASDLHNNVLALSTLEQVADNGPVFFPGDLTDRGSPLETSVVDRVVHTGKPFVFVSGNHDSDTLERRLAEEGAVVLTQRGRLEADGGYGPVINTIAGLRVVGYSDPFERRASDGYMDHYKDEPSLDQQNDFTNWLRPLIGRVDVVVVHEPQLIARTLEELKVAPPAKPLVFLVGHTHKTALERFANVTVINDGSIGAGGTGNLADQPTAYGLARFVYDVRNGFRPLAADIVSIDPGTLAATARRERLDVTS